MRHTARDHHFFCDGDDECITDNDNDGDDDNDADADDRDSGSLWADQASASHWRTYWGGWRWRGEGGALPQTQCYTILSYMLGRCLCTTMLLILGVPCLCLVLQHTVLVKVLLHRFYLGCLCFTLRALNRTLYKSASVKYSIQ